MPRARTAIAALTGATLAVAAVSLMVTPASAVTPGPSAYVLGGGAVSVIDSGTHQLAGSLTVGAGVADVAISGDGARAVVSITPSDQLAVVDTVSDVVTSTVATGDAPASVALSPAGDVAYVMTAGGVVQAIVVASSEVSASYVVGSTGDLAISPDGRHLFVAAGLLHRIDLIDGSIDSWPVGSGVGAMRVVLSPDGTTAYVTASSIFSGTVVALDAATGAVQADLGFGSMPGQLAVSPDGDRLYVAVQATWVDTGYGAGFFNGRSVRVADLFTRSWIGQIDLGASSSNWSDQHTASGLAVTADGAGLYVGVPRRSEVRVFDTAGYALRVALPLASPGTIAIAPRPGTPVTPRLVDATDDSLVSTTLGGAAGSVLGNDRIGGVTATGLLALVEQIDSGSADVAIAADGIVSIQPGTAIGVHTAAYRLCERAHPANCDEAQVTVEVRAPSAIDAVDDSASSLPGRQALASVLTNDRLAGQPASSATVRLAQVSSSAPTIALVPSSGAVFVSVGTTAGPHRLQYRICETANPVNCDEAEVQITVLANAIDAVDDVMSSTRTGGTAGSVLSNDRLAAATATTATVAVTQTTSGTSAVTVTATGAVVIAAGAAVGTHTAGYRICELVAPATCDTATVSVQVLPYQIDAVDDAGRGSSKVANTVVASVLANDRLAGVRATLSSVVLTQISSTNAKVRLQPATGAVVVTGKTASGLHTVVYRICERALVTNCDTATVRIDLSGRS